MAARLANPSLSKSAMRRLRRKVKVENGEDDECSSYCSSSDDDDECVRDVVVTSSHSFVGNGISEVHEARSSIESNVTLPPVRLVEPVKVSVVPSKLSADPKKPTFHPVDVTPKGVAGDLLSMLLTSSPAPSIPSATAMTVSDIETSRELSTSVMVASIPGEYYQSKSGFSIRLE